MDRWRILKNIEDEIYLEGVENIVRYTRTCWKEEEEKWMLKFVLPCLWLPLDILHWKVDRDIALQFYFPIRSLTCSTYFLYTLSVKKKSGLWLKFLPTKIFKPFVFYCYYWLVTKILTDLKLGRLFFKPTILYR